MEKDLLSSHGAVSLRLIKRRDAKQLQELLTLQREWLEPWEATTPGIKSLPNAKWLVSGLLAAYHDESALPLVILYEGEIVGQLNVSNILHGSVSSGTIGYWVSQDVAGRGIMTSAVAQAIDYAFWNLGLHRIEIDIRPENTPSLRVVEKLGLRQEGTKRNFIHIDGAWRDHHVFAITKEEVTGRLVNRVSNEHAPKNMDK